MKYSMPFSKSLEFGWRKFKENYKFLICMNLVIFGVSLLFVAVKYLITRDWELSLESQLFKVAPNRLNPSVIGKLIELRQFSVLALLPLEYLLSGWLALGLYRIYLHLFDENRTTFIDLFKQADKIPRMIIIDILLFSMFFVLLFLFDLIRGGGIYQISLVLGILLSLTITAIMVFFMIRLRYAHIALVDKNIGPLESIKMTFRITKGRVFDLIVFFILIGIINVIGVLIIGIGLLVTMPLTALADIYVYRSLVEYSDGKKQLEPDTTTEPVWEMDY